ncbi:hypothetical protein M0813_03690 [Anaeramoeba flamelloides]|uniref:Uncharacterized protein n=1 Tax=Anaeramoeba flamelloides TaxID=1746091 RepID=A0ABQ8XSF4_9EUKA|nr:hypothetical protein M0813_03690 [Anaeramoeba flamelloides]
MNFILDFLKVIHHQLSSPKFRWTISRLVELTGVVGFLYWILLYFKIQKNKKTFLSHYSNFQKLVTVKDRLSYFPEQIKKQIEEQIGEGETILDVAIPQGNNLFSGALLLYYLFSFVIVCLFIISTLMIYNGMIPYFSPGLLIIDFKIGQKLVKIILQSKEFVYVLTDKKALSYSSPEIFESVVLDPHLFVWELQKCPQVILKTNKDGNVSIIFQKKKTVQGEKQNIRFYGFLYLPKDISKKIASKIKTLLITNIKEMKKKNHELQKNVNKLTNDELEEIIEVKDEKSLESEEAK